MEAYGVLWIPVGFAIYAVYILGAAFFWYMPKRAGYWILDKLHYELDENAEAVVSVIGSIGLVFGLLILAINGLCSLNAGIGNLQTIGRVCHA